MIELRYKLKQIKLSKEVTTNSLQPSRSPFPQFRQMREAPSIFLSMDSKSSLFSFSLLSCTSGFTLVKIEILYCLHQSNEFPNWKPFHPWFTFLQKKKKKKLQEKNKTVGHASLTTFWKLWTSVFYYLGSLGCDCITVTCSILIMVSQGETSNLKTAVSHICNERTGMNVYSANNIPHSQ